jgi:uncharacterized membrane protein YgdD (TMEM256/DUF423 family)
MNPSTWLTLGSLFAALGVGLGAFGAHTLKDRLTPEMLAIFETGAHYQLIHALALVAVGLAAAHWPAARFNPAGWAFLIGILLFSGSLYVLAISGVRVLGAVTPFGGVAFISGWILFALAAWKTGG